MKQQLKIVMVSLFFVFFPVEGAPEVEALKRYLRRNGHAEDGYRPDADSETRNATSLVNSLVVCLATPSYIIHYLFCHQSIATILLLKHFLETLIVHPEVLNKEAMVSICSSIQSNLHCLLDTIK